jgi:hypothetical protein
MIPPRNQSKTERRVDLANMNAAFGAIRRGETVRVGSGMRKETLAGMMLIDLPRVAKAPAEPFEPRIHDRTNRKVRVAAGTCYVYGRSFDVAQTDLTLAVGTTRIWVMFPITPGTADAATVEYGTAEDVNDIDRNTHAFRVLAHVEMGDTDAIYTLTRRWFAGDVYFDD